MASDLLQLQLQMQVVCRLPLLFELGSTLGLTQASPPPRPAAPV